MMISTYRLYVYISHRLIYNIIPLTYLNPFIDSYVVDISRMYDLLAFLLINVSNVCYLTDVVHFILYVLYLRADEHLCTDVDLCT